MFSNCYGLEFSLHKKGKELLPALVPIANNINLDSNVSRIAAANTCGDKKKQIPQCLSIRRFFNLTGGIYQCNTFHSSRRLSSRTFQNKL